MPRKNVKYGDIFGQWKVIEPNIINPLTKNKIYINKPSFSKCICTVCNETTLLILNSELRGRCVKNNSCCKQCSRRQRAEAERKIKIGNTYGLLTIIEDGGYKNHRHYSICKCRCGNIVCIKDNALLTGNTTSCGCQTSKGENRIIELLSQAGIIYDHDCIFPELLKETGHYYRFDFIIYNQDGSLNRFVEYDGRQHTYGPDTNYWGHSTDTLDSIIKKDKIKNDFCLSHDYTLVRIPYTKLNTLSLEDILGNKFVVKGGSNVL